jgi:hypothetical protein
MEYINLEVKNSVIDGKSRRVTHLRDGEKNIELFYEFDRIVPFDEHTVLDGHVFAVLLYACGREKNLRVHGTISLQGLRSMMELQEAWCMLRPDDYKKIDIIADKIQHANAVKKQEKAISLFSGGVDAVYSALRHTTLLAEPIRYPLKSVVMVHGFDIDLYNHEGFHKLVSRVKPFIDELGLDLRVIRTNSRELNIQNWEFSHALELAACMLMFSDEFSYGLIGSSGPYEGFVMPWGSNPVTDNLIRGNGMETIYDGAGTYRTEKIKTLLQFPTVCKILKVCYEATDQSANCGKCEKCVRTRLNFLAAGAKVFPECFPSNFDIAEINTIEINNLGQHKELTRTAKYARKNHVNDPWVDVIESHLTRWDGRLEAVSAQKKVNLCKLILVKLCKILHIDEPIKKIWRPLRRKLLSLKE